MLKKEISALFLLLLVLAILAAGMIELMRLRFEAGDVYPPYSSLRTDPLGTKVFFESADRLDNLAAKRNFDPPSRIDVTPAGTIFFLGISARDFREDDFLHDAEQLAEAGHRVVITFMPLQSSDSLSTASGPGPGAPPPPTGTGPRRQRNRSGAGQNREKLSLRERWGIELTSIPALTNGTPGTSQVFTARLSADFQLPDEISWHSRLRFKLAGDSWSAIYECDNEPVVTERRFGKGQIVLCADSYFLSNEAMYRERHPALLSWIIGPRQKLTFDESHFGITAKTGVAALARKYRLHGLVAALLLLAALFVWKNMSPLVPPEPEPEGMPNDELIGKDSSSGFVNLLRRNVPPSELVIHGYEHWKHSVQATGPNAKAKWIEADAFVAAEKTRLPKERNPVALYRLLAGLLQPSGPRKNRPA